MLLFQIYYSFFSYFSFELISLSSAKGNESAEFVLDSLNLRYSLPFPGPVFISYILF